MDDLRRLDRPPDPGFVAHLETAFLDRVAGPADASEDPLLLQSDEPVNHIVRRPPRRAGLLAAVAVVALVALAGALLSNRGEDRTRNPASRAATTGADVTFRISPVAPNELTRGEGGTRLWSNIAGTMEGDVNGSTTMQGLANTLTTEHDGAEFVFSYIVNGSVTPCGDGQFLMYAVLEYFETDGDITTDDLQGRWNGTWEIVPYSGRSDLAGLAGSGAIDGQLGDDHLNLTGTIDCDGSPISPPSTPADG